ncbi:MAG: alpha/beta fold hydrolase, partial [Solirubrobacterales bacterium]|nr:alpha/beta fold hydrolase [Solirubrobacterales bacterium]
MTDLDRVTLHGRSIAFRRADTPRGDRAILLVHGITNDASSWAPVVERLEGEHDVLAPDLPGHGASDRQRGDHSLGAHASVLRDLVEALHVDRVTVVGHSLGGGIAMQFAYQFPEHVERLVLVSSGGLGREVSPLIRAAALPFAEHALGLLGLP